MATTNHERVGRALALLSSGLAPFAERELKAVYGPNWLDEVTRNDVGGGGVPQKVSGTDVQFLLKTIWNEWNHVFRRVLGPGRANAGQRAARHSQPLGAPGGLLLGRRLPRARQRPPAANGDQRRRRRPSSPIGRSRSCCVRGTRSRRGAVTRKSSAVAPVEGKPTAGLRPWREIVTPHPDVASGRYQQAEFAADLHQVWRGDANEEYGNPQQFFRRTFLTEGLRELLVNALAG